MIFEILNQTEVVDGRPFLIEPLIDQVLPLVANYGPLLIVAILAVAAAWRLFKALVK